MWFGGYQPFTLSDYPGCIAAIAFTQGCNFRCRYCHNASLLPVAVRHSDGLITGEQICAEMAARCGKLGGLVISGGEPTLQEDLPGFAETIKQLGFKIKLDTNGSRPKMIARLLQEHLLDYIAMDVKAPFPAYDIVCGTSVSLDAIQESIALVAASGIDHHFRTTHVPAFMTEEEAVGLKAILPEQSPHVVQQFYPRNALDPQLRSAPAFA